MSLFSQEKKEIKLENYFGDLSARQIGPAVMSGRISDIENISIAQVKHDKLKQKLDRRRERRELDQAAEEAIESKKAARRKPKLTRKSLKIAVFMRLF